MKTTLTPKTEKVVLYTSKQKFGEICLPVYDDKPKVIVFRDTIYLKKDSYYSNDYHAIDSLHVATDSEFTPCEEQLPVPVPVPFVMPTQSELAS